MYYIGIDVGGTNLVAGLVNEKGHILDKVSHPVDKSMTAEELCHELARLAQKVCEMGAVPYEEIEAVGVGLPGLVDNETGMVIQTPNMAFSDTPFRKLFQEVWNVPVFLANDANCAAVGEYWAGAAKGCDPAVVVTLGTGIGGGLVANGKLFTGYANSGMEVGHMIIKPNGVLCGCGNRGCWEQYGSATALIRLTQAEMEKAGLPGLVDNETGMVIQTPNMAFSDTPFRKLFQEVWNVPVFLANDANCAAVGEYWAGAAKGCDPAVVVTLGTGIGGGLVANGKLFTGYANSGMEVGHMIIKPNGVLCGCGNRGCWEQYGSATALIRLTQAEMEKEKDSVMWELCEGDRFKVQGRTAFQGARMGDPAAKRVLGVYLQGLSIGIINLINVLQPEIICLGGGISNAEDDLLLEPLQELVKQGTFDKTRPTRLEKASLGNDAGVVGAALLCNMM